MFYFACTANLGVVPLFLLAAFLFAPIALFFALRRFSVTAVLEAINLSLNDNLDITKFKTLTIRLFFVKAILSQCMAQSIPSKEEDIILSKGEQKELVLEDISQISIGNKDVLSHKFNQKTKKLLIKGKQVGFSDLMVWTKKSKKKFSIYILSKQKFLNTYQIAESLKDLNLTLDVKGPIMTAEGTINQFADYLYIQKIKKKYPDQLFFKVQISPEVRNFVIGKIYYELFAKGFSNFYCQNQWADINCYIEEKNNPDILKELTRQFEVSFTLIEPKNKRKNFNLKLKLFQLERLDGREIQLGLDEINATLGDLFKFGIDHIIQKNNFFLSSSNMELSTLAEPEMIINLDSPQLIEIGSEIPYQNIDSRNQQIIAPIDWKFAGLKIKTHFEHAQGRIKMTYETEFTRPVGEGISGSKEKSSVFLHPGSQIKLFKIGFQTQGKNRKGIPLIRDIPILKHLFESKSDQSTYKQIYGYLQLEEVE